ncbi:MAG: bacterial proteasome activator family protein [Actinomycetota bacterium]|nr:bacterial proteasome activator family protein [Actinomycetota bacterium]
MTVVTGTAPPEATDTRTDEQDLSEGIEHPAKVMRIASMARQLLDEVRHASLDEASRSRMREIYETSVKELSEILSPELRDELERLSLPFNQDAPSDAELRVAHAQLVGWLEGLFHGIQAMLFAQQMESRQRLEEMRRRSLPTPGEAQSGPGTYL